MKMFFKSLTGDFFKQLLDFYKVAKILLAIYIPLVIIWVLLPTEIRQPVIDTAQGSHQWFKDKHVLENMAFYVNFSLRLALIVCVFALSLVTAFSVFIAVTNWIISSIKKEDCDDKLVTGIKIADLLASIVVAYSIATTEMTIKIVDYITSFLRV